jgi:protein arginine kinase activator
MMYCDECKQKTATVHLTQMINGVKTETNLCEDCAAKKGAFVLDLDNQLSIPNLLGSFFGNYNIPETKTMLQTRTCPSCGMSFINLSQTGKLGCSECYTAFESGIEPILRRIHGNSRHTGKIPVRGGQTVYLQKQLQNLKAQLQKAVAEEQYEKAAEIRDKIKDIEKMIN